MKKMRPVIDHRVKKTKWVVLRWPTSSMAQQAGMSTEAFEDFYFRVCLLDYEKMIPGMAALKARLDRTDLVEIRGPGTDLRFSVKNIGTVTCGGDRNIPDGEVFTCPVRDSVQGHVTFNAPTIYQGTSFDGIRLEFQDGKVVRATGNPEAKLNEILDSDEGARYIGEFSIAFNPYVLQPMRDILFDEKISGSFHFTPGQAYEEADNGNKSQVHWDMVCIQRPEWGGGRDPVRRRGHPARRPVRRAGSGAQSDGYAAAGDGPRRAGAERKRCFLGGKPVPATGEDLPTSGRMHPLEERIGYKFRNSLLLAEALTHASLGHETQQVHFDNQRLEYLGDAVLQLLFSEHLFRRFADEARVSLTKGRARLVSGEALAVYAQRIQLGEHLMMGRGDESNGGRRRPSTLADAFEALVGAVYLDGGLGAARAFTLPQARANWRRCTSNRRWRSIPRAGCKKSSRRSRRAAATASAPRNPSYAIVAQVGPDHAKTFTAEVVWNGLTLGRGEGGSKQQAESAAAIDALRRGLVGDRRGEAATPAPAAG